MAQAALAAQRADRTAKAAAIPALHAVVDSLLQKPEAVKVSQAGQASAIPSFSARAAFLALVVSAVARVVLAAGCFCGATDAVACYRALVACFFHLLLGLTQHGPLP